MDNKKQETSNNNDTANLGIFIVMWRNWIIPLMIVTAAAIVLRVGFGYIDNIVFNDYFAGWLSCMIWFWARDYYAT